MDFAVSQGGQVNAAGSVYALMLKVFSGEVLRTFTETNIMRGLHRIRTIASGHTAQFPAFGTAATGGLHVPGAQVDGQVIKSNEKTIAIDGIAYSSVFIDELDELLLHYDLRAPYSDALGRKLALDYDKQCLQVAVLAARAAATITGGNGGSVITDASFSTDGEAMAEGIFDAAQALDEKDIPEGNRTCVVRPAQWYAMARSTKVLNRDWGGKGAYSEGDVLRVAGIDIKKSNNLPSTNISEASPAPRNTYHGNFTTTVGVVFTPEAIGTVERSSLSMRNVPKPENFGDLMIASLAVGHGILRPECSVELKTA